MSVTLDKLQEMWEKDAKIDRDNLHEESLNIPLFMQSILNFIILSFY